MSNNKQGASFLVGIDEYDDSFLKDFPSTSYRDVEVIDAVLGLPASQYKPPSKKFKLFGRRITNNELVTRLAEFLSIAEYTDILIYFSGHGYQIWDTDDDDGIWKGYLATSDSELMPFKDQKDPTKFLNQNNGLTFKKIASMIDKASTTKNFKSLVLLIDACHSGHAITTDDLQSTLFKLRQKSSHKALEDYFKYCIITSSLSSEESRTEDGMGAFTKILYEELSRNDSGQITAERLANGVKSNFNNRHQQTIKPDHAGSILLMNYSSTGAEKTIIDLIWDEDGELVCPYRGLKYFDDDEQQQKFFFGREFDIKKIRDRLDELSFVPVIGASGSGKSSLVRAGLLQKQLKQQESGDWHIVIIMPGGNPLGRFKDALGEFRKTFASGSSKYKLIDKYIDNLSPTNSDPESFDEVLTALRGDKKYLLVIDQFEEVFTQINSNAKGDSQDQNQQPNTFQASLDIQNRDLFLKLVTRVSEVQDSPLKVVATMRADFIGDCLNHPHPTLKDLIENNAVYVAPLIGRGLIEAIEQPAKMQGYPLEPGLVDALVKDVKNEPGYLPLLEFTLEKLWDERMNEPNPHIPLAAYVEPGNERTGSGLKHYLNLHANNVFKFANFNKKEGSEEPLLNRNAEEQKWIRSIFLRLVRTGQGNTDARYPQPISSLLSIVGDLDRQRLETVIESLIEGRLLVSYDDRDKGKMLDLAHEALIDGWLLFSKWRTDYRDLVRLRTRIEDQRKVWEEQGCDDNNLLSRGLLAQVKQVTWEELQTYFTDGADKEFYDKSKDYWDGQDIAAKRRTLELQLQVDAAQIERKIAARKPAHEILTAAIQMVGRNREHFPDRLIGNVPASLRQVVENIFTSPLPSSHTDSVNSVAISPDGQTIVSGSYDGTVRLWNLDGSPKGSPFEGHTNSVRSVAISPDGQTIVSGSGDETVRLWNLDGTPKGSPFEGHTASVNLVAYSPDGQTIVSGSSDKTVRLWNLDGSPKGSPFEGHTASVNSVAYSPDGQTIVSGSGDNTVRLWNLDGSPKGSPFEGHTASVNSVAYSPDGQTIVSGSDDKTVRMWNLDGSPKGTPFEGHTGYVLSVAISPDGQTIVSGSSDKTVRLWNLDGSPKGTPFEGHTGYVNSVAISPDGQTIVSGSGDNTVRLWNLDGSPKGSPFEGHTNSVRSVAISPDGQTIVSGSDDKTVRLWNLDGSPKGSPFEGHTNSVRSVAISPDGQTIVSGSDDKTVRLWNLDGSPKGSPFEGHTNSVNSVAISPDGQTIVSGSEDKTMRLWNLDGSPKGTPFEGHTNSVRSVAISPDGQTIVSGSGDTVRLWNLDGSPKGTPFKGHTYYSVNSVAFSPDGQTIVSSSSDKTVRLWNLDGSPKGTPFKGHTNSVNSVAFSPDGQTIVSGSGDNTVRLWNLDGSPKGSPFEGHTYYSVNSVAFSPDGQTIVSGSSDKTVRLWNLDGSPKGSPFEGHTYYSVNSVAFSPDGQTIVSSSSDKTVRLWNLDGSPKGTPFEGHTGYVLSVAFSPDGQTIVSGSGYTVRLWNLDGSPKGSPFEGHTDYVLSVAISPDGQTIVSGSSDRTVRLWNLDGSPEGSPFEGHINSVRSVAISPDGQTIVSGSDDKTVRLWNLDGSPKGTPFEGHTHFVSSVAFSPDGQTIVSGSYDNAVRLWDLDGTPKGTPFEGHTHFVFSVAISPDGQTIVSGSGDETVRLWNLDGSPKGSPFEGHTDSVWSVAISPDGQTIVSGSNDNTVRVWHYVGWRSWLRTCLRRLGNHWRYDQSGLACRARLFEEGYRAAEQGNLELAEGLLLRALQTGKTDDLQIGGEGQLAELGTMVNQLIAPILIGQGKKAAQFGKVDEAQSKFEQAKQRLPDLLLEPIAEARRLSAPIFKMQGIMAALDGHVVEAIAKFTQAKQYAPELELDPETEAKRIAAPVLLERGKGWLKQEQVSPDEVQKVLEVYQTARTYDPTLEITARDWNSFLWDGSLHAAKEPKLVKALLEASQEALRAETNNASYRDTLGVARVLAGGKRNRDNAIKDFEFFIEKTNSAVEKEQRQRWIAALKEGQNPLTEDEIKILLRQ